MSGKRKFACWKCAGAMRKKGLVCKACRRSDPAAVKAQMVTLTKSFGAPVRPVPVPKAAKPPRPVCPNPECRAKGKPGDNCCTRCSAPFSMGHALRADKAIGDRLAGIHGTPEWWEKQARAADQYNPADREACRAEAARARQAAGQETAHLASMVVKASGARGLREAYARETDPRAQQILRDVMGGA
jgi:hypothetical protein